MTTVRWSKPARQDLASIDDHYAAIAPAFADRMARDAVAAGRFLADYPLAGASAGLGDTRKWRVPNTPYVLLYRLTGRDVEIVRVRHAQQDWTDGA